MFRVVPASVIATHVIAGLNTTLWISPTTPRTSPLGSACSTPRAPRINHPTRTRVETCNPTSRNTPP
ncbi:uncharacterized protein MICPUCDRAFT_54768 [Micromonas pusilla CCMP1545]|uniref:Predicted protein n=1 Tax=Micromonas pusilla (strain CCMP1545) TaxID=564608 RepID=C1NA56_MICPC|nr:uncharacterized protein MICPUCDRAFT_54768 [Micromonas pusilla CCMP1545]EEH51066.1 predicted protein [Micromonas pusilla CCMP1545]|eukprot:XP_003064732.1 predicted protein [Micromonas pusilla CCMP1545]